MPISHSKVLEENNLFCCKCSGIIFHLVDVTLVHDAQRTALAQASNVEVADAIIHRDG